MGQRIVGSDSHVPLIERWNGSSWSVTSVPANPGGSGDYWLNGVARLSGTDAYAVGAYIGSTTEMLVLHWNGSSWAVVPGIPTFPSPQFAVLQKVKPISSSDIWAVGTLGNLNTAELDTLVLHWNGSTWTVVASPTGTGQDTLYGISGGPHDLWAVGQDNNFGHVGDTTIVLHYDGTSWTRISSPSPDAKVNNLAAVDTVNGSTNAWAVGNTKKKTLTMRICPVRVTDSAISPATAEVADGSTVAWSFPDSNGASHTVTDTTGLGLYNSGSRAPGYSFTTQFKAAGTYSYRDTASGRTGKIQIPVNATPSSGGQNDFFAVSWAFNVATPPYVYDVQVKGPADSGYLPWQTANTTGTAVFQPSSWQGGEGAGVYRFRARLRNTNTGAMTDWSPATKITVT